MFWHGLRDSNPLTCYSPGFGDQRDTPASPNPHILKERAPLLRNETAVFIPFSILAPRAGLEPATL